MSFDRARRPVLLALLAMALGLAFLEWTADPDGPAALPAAHGDSASHARAPLTPEQRAESVQADSAERASAEAMMREWLGPQRWIVTPANDSSADFVEAALVDSTMPDVMRAFVTIGALRDSTGAIELLGSREPGRAVLVGNVDSLVRVGVEERWKGCVLPLQLPLRRGADSSEWRFGFVPGMAAFVLPRNAATSRDSAEALRLLAALPDTGEYLYGIDSLRNVPWPPISATLWHIDEDNVELLVASRTRSSGANGAGPFVHEQIVVAERPIGSAVAFTTVVTWHSAYNTDETRSEWLEGAVRIGPRRRFALLMSQRGKEGGAGTLLVRVGGEWREAVTWSSGC